MAERVVFHIGTPKTGTTYLQTLVWRHRKRLRKQGLLFPGDRRADHLWGSMEIRDDPHVRRRSSDAPGAWDRICSAAAAWPHTVLISHEFYGAATPEQAARALDDLAPARVELVATARDAVSAVTSMWSQSMKFRHTRSLREFADDDTEDDPLNVWGWRTLDAAHVLERWSADLAPEQVHVIPMPRRGAPPDELWRRFADVLGVDAGVVDAERAQPNDSLGLVETELLRLLNTRLSQERMSAERTARWVRGYLARDVLVPHGRERFVPPADQRTALRRRAERIVDDLAAAGYSVVGDLADLRPGGEDDGRRSPEDVSPSEILDAAADTIVTLFAEVRRLSDDDVAPHLGR
jgi:hypothetical protein